MHRLFIEGPLKITYDAYRKIFATLNISFTKLGEEECETCEEFTQHKCEAEDGNECSKCLQNSEHLQRASISRKAY